MKGKEKAVERLRRLLNTDSRDNECEIRTSYEKSVKNGSENRQQAID